MELHDNSQQGRRLTYIEAEPLDWFQFRALLQEALETFNENQKNRWQQIAAFVNDKCEYSPAHPPLVYQRVFNKIALAVPEIEDLSGNPGLGHRLWNEILYTNAQVIFKSPAFMNLGYVEREPGAQPLSLEAEDEPYRLCIELYERVLRGVDLKGLEVLEVGCGAGGGCSYIMRYLNPASITGVDLVEKNIEACSALHSIPGISFVVGDAESLQFPADSFDAVVNIESSHHYSSITRFFNETSRVLRSNGYFLFADLRTRKPEWGDDRTLEVLHEQLEQSGLRVLKAENISSNIISSIDLQDEAKQMMLAAAQVNEVEYLHFQEILLCKGSRNYKKLESGDFEYWTLTCQK